MKNKDNLIKPAIRERAKFYVKSDLAWVAMVLAIKEAREFVYLESYILTDDVEAEYGLFSVLAAKAKAGVSVKIIIDGFGSWDLTDETREKLNSAGVELLSFDSWFRRIHRKILIVDGKTAFLGGVNVGKRFGKWSDLHIKIYDRHTIKSLTRSFAKSYYYCGGKDEDILELRKKSILKKAELWLLEHFPSSGKLLLRRYYKDQISQAKNKIIFVTPYFAPAYWLTRVLNLAIKRGVKVEVIMPMNTDPQYLNLINYSFAETFYKKGIEFYLTRDMIHAKVLLVDDRVGLVGSQNLDVMSFNVNSEASFSFEKKEMVDELRTIISIWRENAVPFEPIKHNTPWYFTPLKTIVNFLRLFY